MRNILLVMVLVIIGLASGVRSQDPLPEFSYFIYNPIFLPNRSVFKGVAMAYIFCEDAPGVKASWIYTWGAIDPECPGVEFVPMAWGANEAWWPKPGYTSSEWLAFLNEPDLKGQANRTPIEGAIIFHDRLVPRYPGKKFLSPAPSHLHPEWLVEFRDAHYALYGEYPQLDALAAHCYGRAEFCKTIVSWYEQKTVEWDIPGGVWLTEFAFDNVKESQLFIEWLNRETRVTRYAWFLNRDPIPLYQSQPLFTADGVITEYGEMYKIVGDDAKYQ